MGFNKKDKFRKGNEFLIYGIPLFLFSVLWTSLAIMNIQENRAKKEDLKYFQEVIKEDVYNYYNSDNSLGISKEKLSDKEWYNLLLDLEEFTGKNYLNKPLGYKPNSKELLILHKIKGLSEKVR
jgi:hypothetical protein